MRTIVFAATTVWCTASARAEPHLDLPPVDAIEPDTVREDTPGPVYYRQPDDVVRPLARTGLGFGLRSSAEDHGGTAFALDVFGGAAVRFGRNARTGLWIEGGYSYDRFGDHLIVGGLGPALYRIDPGGLADGSLSVAIVPHAVFGSIGGTTGYGIRTSAIASFWIYGIELSHQYVVAGTHGIHELRLMFTAPMILGDS